MSERLNLAEDLQYIDGITIIDIEGVIRYSLKFNPVFSPESYSSLGIIGRKLSEIFPNITETTSTLYEAMNLNRVVMKRRQKVQLVDGSFIETMNVTLPITVGEKIIGAIELSKDITDRRQKEQRILEIDRELFHTQVTPDMRLGSNTARYTLEHLITANPALLDLKARVEAGSGTSAPCFIYGETGTGKEILAHSLHTCSDRRDKPFISQNCAAIPENLLESILFGTVKGSYSGAVDAAGLFELANGGTLFLDEINSLSVSLQAKLLRVIEDGYIRRVGGSTEKRFDVRIIAAANEEPLRLVESGRLRRDIYYRLCVLYFHIPPLRERVEDIELLMHHFIRKHSRQNGRSVSGVSREVLKFFRSYAWPGNVRELEHFILFGVTHALPHESILEMRHIEHRIPQGIADPAWDESEPLRPLAGLVEELERRVMGQAIRKTGGNASKAARILGIPRQTLARKLAKYGIGHD
jgi:arginine utilization regulatory protein